MQFAKWIKNVISHWWVNNYIKSNIWITVRSRKLIFYFPLIIILIIIIHKRIIQICIYHILSFCFINQGSNSTLFCTLFCDSYKWIGILNIYFYFVYFVSWKIKLKVLIILRSMGIYLRDHFSYYILFYFISNLE